MRIPIQMQPGSTLVRLRKRYGKNHKDHIHALEQVVMDKEFELDKTLHRLYQYQRVLMRLQINLEELE